MVLDIGSGFREKTLEQSPSLFKARLEFPQQLVVSVGVLSDTTHDAMGLGNELCVKAQLLQHVLVPPLSCNFDQQAKIIATS